MPKQVEEGKGLMDKGLRKDRMGPSLKRALILFLAIIFILGLALGFFYYYMVLPNEDNFPDLPPVDYQANEEGDYEEDFSFAYESLKESYPFFEINKIKTGTDWLANKDAYLDRIRACKTDQDFCQEMARIMEDLNNDHSHVIESDWGLDYYYSYKTLPSGDYRTSFAQAFEDNPQARARYNINNESLLDYSQLIEEYREDGSGPDNLRVEDLVPGQVAYISIASMLGPDQWARDEEVLVPFLEQIQSYPVLIIDIRGNGGGNSAYYSDFLYPKIIDQTYSTKTYSFLRTDAVDKVVCQAGYKRLREGDIEKLAFGDQVNRILQDFEYYSLNETIVRPGKDSIKYQGQIYLIVDEGVYSSAESMASFSKESGLVKLVGTRTGGDGLGSDPRIISLPNTGLALRYSLELGISQFGSINELDQTQPHYSCQTQDKETKGLLDQEAIRIILDLEGIGY